MSSVWAGGGPPRVGADLLDRQPPEFSPSEGMRRATREPESRIEDLGDVLSASSARYAESCPTRRPYDAFTEIRE